MHEIRLFGQFDIHEDGRPVRLPSRQAQSLLAFLLLSQGKRHRREELAGLLWPDIEEAVARRRLRYAIWQIRQALGGDLVAADRISVAIQPAAELWVDVTLINHNSAEVLSLDRLRQIDSAYAGPLLPGFYEEWILLERDRLHAVYERHAAELLARLLAERQWREVIERGERWIAFGGAPETAFRALMRAHSGLGDVAGALATYERCRQALDQQLGVSPSSVTRQLYEQLLSLRNGGDQVPTMDIPAVTERAISAMLPDEPVDRRPVFVMRHLELARMARALSGAASGNGQVILVRGLAGQGKTSLLREFTRQVQVTHQDLLVVYGRGEAYTGASDPYLLFRDALSQLTGDTSRAWAADVIGREGFRRLFEQLPDAVEALVTHGADLIDRLVSGNSLLARAAPRVPAGTPWLAKLRARVIQNQERPEPLNIQHRDPQRDLFEQLTRVVQAITDRQLLLLILDDLQWADPGTLDLLFYLSRRVERHRALIILAYRPDEIPRRQADADHPMHRVLAELKRQFGEIEIDLDAQSKGAGRAFVDALIDADPNRLGEPFRGALFRRTGGHPLFSVELLRQLQAQGDLKLDESGRWIEASRIDWGFMPARVEAVIEGRVGALDHELQEILAVASVLGEEFEAEVVARVLGERVSVVVKRLSRDLGTRHLLIEASGNRYVGAQRLSFYRFHHHLTQAYVAGSLDEIERTHLNEAAGNALESLYRDDLDAVALRLARHFEAAGRLDKAVVYLQMAGEIAKRLPVNEEAIAHFAAALRLLDQLPDTRAREETELGLRLALAAPLVAARGYTAPEVESTYERARVLSEQVASVAALGTALWGLWSFYLVRGRQEVALTFAERILGLAQHSRDPDMLLVARWTLGISLTHQGEFSRAMTSLDEAIDRYNEPRLRHLTYRYGQHPRATCLIYSAFGLWFLGFPNKARERSREALAIATASNHAYSLSFAHGMLAIFHALARDETEALVHAEETMALARASGFPFLLSVGIAVRGWSRAMSGKTTMAATLVHRGLAGMQAIGAELGRPLLLALYAEASLAAGDVGAAQRAVAEALALAKANGERLNLADLARLQVELAARGTATWEKIDAGLLEAEAIAGGQSARAMSLRIGLSRYRLGVEHGAGEETGASLRRQIDQFAGEEMSVDLEEARQLLSDLSPT